MDKCVQSAVTEPEVFFSVILMKHILKHVTWNKILKNKPTYTSLPLFFLFSSVFFVLIYDTFIVENCNPCSVSQSISSKKSYHGLFYIWFQPFANMW